MCAEIIEKAVLASPGSRVHREGKTLNVVLSDGTTRTFPNANLSFVESQYYLGFAAEIRYFVFYAVYKPTFSDKDGYLVVSGDSGEARNIDSPPLISPDHRWLVTSFFADGFANYTIFAVHPGYLETQRTPEQEASAAPQLEWLDSTTLKVTIKKRNGSLEDGTMKWFGVGDWRYERTTRQ
jgi:hypothetical protein